MRTSWWSDNHIVMRIVLLIVIAGSALMPGCSTASSPPTKAATSLAALEARRVQLPSIDPTLQIDGIGFTTVVVFLALVDVPPSPAAHTVSGGCGSTTVYQGSPPSWLVDAAGGPAAPSTIPYVSSPSGLIGGFIFGYPLRAGTPANRASKILWAVATTRNGASLEIQGHPQHASTPVVTYRFPDNASPGEIYPSIVEVPSPGCWAFTMSWGTSQAEVQLSFAA